MSSVLGLDRGVRLDGLTYEQYAALDGVRASDLLALVRSPADYAWRREHPTQPTDAMVLGTLVHQLVLEPDRPAPTPWTGGRRAGAAWQEYVAARTAEGEPLITADQLETALAMWTAVTVHHPGAAELVSRLTATEVTIQWEGPGGTVCKSRLDGLVEDDLGTTVVELKTAHDVSPRAFSRAAANRGYHLQAAFYLDAYEALHPSPRQTGHIIVAVESTVPHHVACYRLEEEAIERGRTSYQSAMLELAQCLESDEWPGPAGDAIEALALPRWVL
uniref:Putative exodeoxyribonuclease 8 PDDEXK-like domain-containing protein n=1 Tax=viral metagenome TaxID=1070528 RepID=A0A6M3IKZ8_9ZZZZ